MSRATRTLALSASVCAALFLVAGSSGAAQPAAVAAPTVIVSASDAGRLPPGARFVAEIVSGLRYYVLTVPPGTTPGHYAAALASRDGVYAAQPNTRLTRGALAAPCADPPDLNRAQRLPAAVSSLSVQAPGPTPPVAVLDTGVDASAPELAGRVRTGFNSVDGSADTSDSDGHGTEVASIVSGTGRFQGVSPTTPIIPIKIYNRSSETTVDWVVKGIDAAVKAGAPIINISSSNPAKDVAAADASVLQQAITAAFAKGTITVVAAGNEGRGTAAIPGSLERVLTVGSANAEGTRDAFSNFGPWVDIVSPGADLILPAPKTVCESGYGTASGTSFSAPAVAGAAALILALRPELNAQQLYDLMRLFSAKELYAPGRDDDSGYGLLSVSEGAGATLPARQATEVDDDVFWLKADPKAHPPFLGKARLAKLKSSIQAGKDPQDLYPVTLKKGELLTVTVAAAKSTSLLDIAVWSPSTGSFDVGLGKTDKLVKDTGGLTNSPALGYRAKRAGTYYVSVEGPDLPTPPTAQEIADNIKPVAVEGYTRYSMTLRKTPAKKAKKQAKKK